MSVSLALRLLYTHTQRENIWYLLCVAIPVSGGVYSGQRSSKTHRVIAKKAMCNIKISKERRERERGRKQKRYEKKKKKKRKCFFSCCCYKRHDDKKSPLDPPPLPLPILLFYDYSFLRELTFVFYSVSLCVSSNSPHPYRASKYWFIHL